MTWRTKLQSFFLHWDNKSFLQLYRYQASYAFFSLSVICVNHIPRDVFANTWKLRAWSPSWIFERTTNEIKAPRDSHFPKAYIHLALVSVLSSSLSTEHHKAGAGERSVLGDRNKRGWQLRQKTQATLFHNAYSTSCTFTFCFRAAHDLRFYVHHRPYDFCSILICRHWTDWILKNAYSKWEISDVNSIDTRAMLIYLKFVCLWCDRKGKNFQTYRY